MNRFSSLIIKAGSGVARNLKKGGGAEFSHFLSSVFFWQN